MYTKDVLPPQELGVDVEIHWDWYLVQNAYRIGFLGPVLGGVSIMVSGHVNLSDNNPNRMQSSG